MLLPKDWADVGVGHHSFTFQFNFQIRKRGGERCVVGLTSPAATRRVPPWFLSDCDCDHALGFNHHVSIWQTRRPGLRD